MKRTLVVPALLALILSACASSATTVPVKGSSSEMALLAGEWRGDFEDPTSDRHGRISFDLEMGRHTAQGQVVMFPPRKGEPPMKLRIEYLSVEKSRVTGKLESYTDPECNCIVETEFVGDVTGDFILGSYAANMAGQGERKGEWTAERVDR